MQTLFGFILAPARLRLLFWLLLGLTLMMALLPHPPHVVLDRFGDKAEHMVAFFTLTLVADLGWRDARRWALLGWLAAFGAAIEFLQEIPALQRDSDWHDWVADVLAVLLALALARLIEPLADWLSGSDADTAAPQD